MFNSLRRASLFSLGGAMILVFALLGASDSIRKLVFPEQLSPVCFLESLRIFNSKGVLDQLPMPLLKCLAIDRIDVLPPSLKTDGAINDASIKVRTDATAKEFENFYESWIVNNDWNYCFSGEIPIYIWNGAGRLARDKEGNLWNFVPPKTGTNTYQIIFRKSYERLVVGQAPKLDSKYVGYVASTTFTYHCFQRLLAKKSKYWNEFVEMTKTGTPAGRVYGAILLFKTDPNKARPILNQMLADNSEMRTQGGCLVHTTTVKAEISELLKSGKSVADNWDDK